MPTTPACHREDPVRSLFTRAPAPLLGVDVGASSIKVVELSPSRGGGLVLAHCATEPLERGWVADGVVERFDEVAQALRRAVARSGSRARQAALALPASAVITRRIVLPASLTERELELQVEAEAGEFLPFPLEDVSLDFCPAGPARQAAGDQAVLVAASRRDRVQDCAGLAEAAGLKATIVDVQPCAARLAAARVIGALVPAGGVAALFEIGALQASLQVLRDGEVLHERDQAFGGDQLTQLLAAQYGLAPAEAERLAREGRLPADAQRSVLPAFCQGIAQDVARTLQFLSSSTSLGPVDAVLLAGGAAAAPGLEEAVAQAASVACQRLQPFDGMALGAGVAEAHVRRHAPAYLTACGLALRRFLPAPGGLAGAVP